MKIELLAHQSMAIQTSVPKIVKRLLKSALISKLSEIKQGYIELIDGSHIQSFGDAKSPLKTRINVYNQEFYSLVALKGTIGAGEGYIYGFWKCENLTNLIRIMIMNRESMEKIDGGFSKLSRPFMKVFHSLRKNTIKGSSKNIQAHYDLGNDFFSLFLDPTMTYSSGIFNKADSTLEEASIEKYDRICRKLNLKPTDSVIEIGTGWGGFAYHAAKNYGCKIRTTTISKQQFEWAKAKIKNANLEHLVEVVMLDYRELTGEYDKLVSVEMLEAVGHQYYQNFFETCARLLKPDGVMCIQSITIKDQIYDVAKDSVDFIQRYIFPGGSLPSILTLSDVATKFTDLNLIHLEDFTAHYARTLREWFKNLNENKSEVLKAGYPEELLRLWEFYFCYCEGGFLERNVGVVQVLFAKSEWRGNAPLASV